MLALYMDHNVPRAISEGLRLRGIDVITAYEDSADDMNDPALLDRATELGRALFTQDDDLLAEATKRQKEGVIFGGVIYSHQLQIKKNTKVKVQYRPELGAGSVLQVAEASGGEYNVDVVFEKDGKRFLETFPQSLLTPVADIFQRYQNNESDHPTDFFLKQLACQLPLENSGGELSNSKTDLFPHQILLTHQIISARRRKFLIADEVGLGKTIEVGLMNLLSL